MKTDVMWSLRVFPVGPENEVCWIHCGFYPTSADAYEAGRKIEEGTLIKWTEVKPLTVKVG
jgi:hypothetical protein